MPEKSNATISASMMMIADFKTQFAPMPVNKRTRERAAYEHAIAFDTTKYLVHKPQNN
jgi:hypothetical protein